MHQQRSDHIHRLSRQAALSTFPVSSRLILLQALFAGDTIQEQTRQSLTNIKNILAEAGTDLDHVVRVDVFMKDMNMFADMNAVYAEFFTEKCPARAAVEVARLPKDALVEIGAIAVVD